MKKLFADLRNKLALIFLGAILVLPSVSVLGLTKGLRNSDSRKVVTASAFQLRAVDKTTLAYAPFSEPLVSVTFDDGWESIYIAAYPLLQKYGIRSTQYILSGELKDQNYMSVAQIKAMQKSGHDIACHTVSHADLTKLDAVALHAQLADCKTRLELDFGKIADFASPYGASNVSTLKAISKYFDSQRNTKGDITNGVTDDDVNVSEGFSPYDIVAVTIRRDTPISQIKALLDYGRTRKAWVVFTYHQIDEGESLYGLDEQKLEEQIRFISEYNVRIATVRDVMKSLVAFDGTY